MLGGRWRSALVALLIGAGSPRFALAQSSPPPSEESWPPPSVAAVPGRVLVHIESPVPVDLQRGTGDVADPFYVMCTSPCDTWVPATDRYRIAGGDTRPSDRFELLANAERETVVVSPTSSARFGIGVALIVVGGVAGLIGTALFLGYAGDLADGVLVGASLADAGGIVLVVLNHASRVHQTTAFGPNAFGPSAFGASAFGPRVESSSAFLPSEVEHRGAPIPGYPRAASWPLLRLTF